MNFIIETERLALREFKLSDANEMFLLNADYDVIKYTGDAPFKSIEEAETLIINYDQYKKYKMGRFTLLLKETGEYLGWCGLKYLEDAKETDIGFRLHKKQWGRGYATEAAAACLQYGFEELKLKKIIGRALKANIASIHVLEKIGMQYEREEILHDGPAVIYATENNLFMPERENS
ncbi:MAG TPA: GNAT family N-acetyltransferase [Bacteroidia bacterium]|nr:GNAT family N-acetyltransferase [Bacteroidia bacterium]